jgi:hypothetical protein
MIMKGNKLLPCVLSADDRRIIRAGDPTSCKLSRWSPSAQRLPLDTPQASENTPPMLQPEQPSQ